MKKLYFISGNLGKIQEAKEKFAGIGIEIIQKNIGYPEIQANTLEEVALYGSENIRNRFDEPFILEDAGLFIDAFKGFPGVYSAYVYFKIGCEGILKLMKDIKDNTRNAIFRSVYSYCELNRKPVIFVGECNGKISKSCIGNYGFGFDPIFIPAGEKRTFAQMDINEKNNYSHRGKSLQKLIYYIKNH
jgi:XTP/dITP diphosphohydrolase